jgi:hypothetical protein
MLHRRSTLSSIFRNATLFTSMLLVSSGGFAKTSEVQKLFPLDSFGSKQFQIHPGPIGFSNLTTCQQSDVETASVKKMEKGHYLFSPLCSDQTEIMVDTDGSYLMKNSIGDWEPYLKNPVDENAAAWLFRGSWAGPIIPMWFEWKYVGDYRNYHECWFAQSAQAGATAGVSRVFCENVGLIEEIFVQITGQGYSAILN